MPALVQFDLVIKALSRCGFFLLVIPALLPARAQVSPVGHEQCLQAADYKGCIEVFSGTLKNHINPSTQNIKLNIDTQVASDGNECPSEFAYAGGGYCRRVKCVYGGLFGTGHHPDLAGKGIKCHKGLGQMQWGEWDKEKVRASVNPACPNIPLEVGFQSTCQMSGIKGSRFAEDGRYEDALKVLRPLSDANTKDWIAATNAAYSFFQTGNYADAVIYARRADESLSSGEYKYLTEINLAIMLEAQESGSSEAKQLAARALKKQPRLRELSFLREKKFAPLAIPMVSRLLEAR